MKLRQILSGLEVAAPAADGEITGISVDSRTVQKGNLFVALPGSKDDGAKYVADAIAKGAAAIVSEKEVTGTKLPRLVVPNARKAVAVIAANWFGNPAKELTLLGVTGTNGKTTTAWLLEAMAQAGGAATGLLGTIANRWTGESRPPTHTTPDPLGLHAVFRQMVDAGVEMVAMEVSSHALAQERVHGLTFRSAAFTNLTRDHLDFHKDLESYFQAKRKLFTENLSAGGVAVVNGDDTNAVRIYNEVRGQKRMAWKFSRTGAGEISAAGVEFTNLGITGKLKTPAGDIPIKSELIGAHNLENILAAAGVALSAGFSRRDVQDGIERCKGVPGRMQRVEGKGVVALIDYAHTDDALRRSLESARTFTKGKVLVVFGCGGDRDQGKRPLMGQVAAELADLPIVTSDNPRTEDPDDIVAQVIPGLEKAGLRRVGAAKVRSGEKGYLVEANRAQAIALAVQLAKPGDTIVIAGKGHEAYQEQDGEKKHFDDVEEARKALA